MADYDVIVIGGGINGLTCAAYLGKAGLKTLVLEARGECGAHCDTVEAGLPGYLFNTHAVWMVTPLCPAMEDLDLSRYGLEWRRTDYAWGKTFADGTNALNGNNPMDTLKNWERHSPRDADKMRKSLEYFFPRMDEFTDIMHRWLYTPPAPATMKGLADFAGGLFAHMGVACTGERFFAMNGFDAMNMVFESEHIKTTAQALGWIGGFNPLHKTIGALGSGILGLLIGPLYPSVVVRGGSHELTHVLVKACLAHGVVVQPNCPVKSIIVQNGEARGVVLSDSAVFPGETIMAKKIVSNTTVHPTFLDMVGREHLGDMAPVIDRFSYDEQNLYTVHFALGGAPRFASADFDDGIQRCYMGYFGGEDSASMKRFAENISMHRRVIHDEIIGNYFITTLADPLQAPPGCHTSHVWFDVPPEPVAWRDEKLGGMNDWDRIKERLADEIEETYERYAPGFKKLVRDRIVYTPLDQYRNNMAAVKGNWAGGSMIPEQFYDRRPLPGILRAGSATRSFIRNLHLSNSIHVASNSTLAPGYLAATEVAEDLGARDHDWWQARACSWYLQNQGAIPSNMGVK